MVDSASHPDSIATIMFSLGAASVGDQRFGGGTEWAVGRLVLVLLVAGCFGMGLVWFLASLADEVKQSVLLWGPARCASRRVVSSGGSRLQDGCRRRSVLRSGYAALFHTLRVLAYVWLIASVTVVYPPPDRRARSESRLCGLHRRGVVECFPVRSPVERSLSLTGTDDPRAGGASDRIVAGFF